MPSRISKLSWSRPKLIREVSAKSPAEPNLPNDPMFGDQWALKNAGQNGGKENADIAALKAWAKTKGSKKIVVAVLDTGVDYTHLDLVSNIWIRPDSVPQYRDDELGVFNDLTRFQRGGKSVRPDGRKRSRNALRGHYRRGRR